MDLGLQGLGDIAPSIPKIAVDKDSMYVGGALSAAVGGVSLATLAGGTGIALIAAGPVGWLIGLGLGALFGGGLGAIVARGATRNDLKPEHRQQVIGELKQHEARVRSALTRSLNEWKHGTISELESMRSSFFTDRENELRRIEQIIGDESTRVRELSRINELIERVKAITPCASMLINLPKCALRSVSLLMPIVIRLWCHGRDRGQVSQSWDW
jgi:hypothetical protein